MSLLMGLTGAAVLAVVTIALKDLWPPPSMSVPSLVRALYLFIVATVVILASLGFALLALARMCYRGNREGRALAFVLLGLVVVSCALSPLHEAPVYVTLVLAATCIGILALLPSSRKFFARADPRPVGVVMATTIVSYFIWDYALLGAVLITVYPSSKDDLGYGAVLVAGSLVLLTVNRALRHGSAPGRVIASLTLGAVGVVSVIANHQSLGAFVLPGLAAAALGGLWIPESSNRFFASPSLAVPGGVKQYSGTIVGAVIVVAVLLYASLPETSHNLTSATPVGSTGTIATIPSPSTGSSGLTPYRPQGTSGGSYVNAGPFVHTWVAYATAAGGYTETITVSAGNPQHFNPELRNNQAVLGETCGGDTTTDAVVPIELNISNTSSAFSAPTSAELSWQSYSGTSGSADESMVLQGDYDNGEQCSNSSDTGSGGNSAGLSSLQPLAPGNATSLYGFFIISNYYSPDTPSGDSGYLAGTWITLSGGATNLNSGTSGSSGNSGSGNLDWTVTSLTGPGVQSSEFNLAGAPPPATSGTGTSGTNGNSGTAGTSGTSGTSDTAGTSGTSGTSGSAGLSGTSGNSG